MFAVRWEGSDVHRCLEEPHWRACEVTETREEAEEMAAYLRSVGGRPTVEEVSERPETGRWYRHCSMDTGETYWSYSP